MDAQILIRCGDSWFEFSKSQTGILDYNGKLGTNALPNTKGYQELASRGISMLLITQSSSEYTISFCVNQKDARRLFRIYLARSSSLSFARTSSILLSFRKTARLFLSLVTE